jgi:AcrR family transcriptional regulator
MTSGKTKFQAMTRNADATRKRIIEAATAEFAEFGIAGARVDRIAENAKSNKQLLYQYFGNKEKLFRIVVAQELARATEGVAFPSDDLPQYAAAYFDFAMANPRLMRLVAWCGLELSGPIEGVPTAETKLARVAALQKRGDISKTHSPEFILSTISALAMAWAPSNWYATQLDPNPTAHAARYRESIIQLVAAMIGPAKSSRRK